MRRCDKQLIKIICRKTARSTRSRRRDKPSKVSHPTFIRHPLSPERAQHRNEATARSFSLVFVANKLLVGENFGNNLSFHSFILIWLLFYSPPTTCLHGKTFFVPFRLGGADRKLRSWKLYGSINKSTSPQLAYSSAFAFMVAFQIAEVFNLY